MPSVKHSTMMSDVHSISMMPKMLVNFDREAGNFIHDDPVLVNAEMNLRKNKLGAMSMGNMKRRQKLYLE